MSVYPRRSVNLKRFAMLILGIATIGGAGYALHRMQTDKNAELMLRMAQNTRTLGNLNEALTLYERYLNFRPKNSGAMVEYLDVLEEASKTDPKRVRELYDGYERLLNAEPKRIDDRKKIIEKYMAARVYSRATRHLEELMKQDNGYASDPLVLDQYGLCAQRLGQKDQAIDRYRAAIETGKASSETYLRLANLLQGDAARKGSLEEARVLLDRLIADRPKDPAARLARARYFLTLKQPGEAIRELETAITNNIESARNIEIVLVLANLHQQIRNLPAARDVLARAVAVSPNELRFRIVYADLLAALGDTVGGDKQLQESLKLVPLDDPMAVDVLDRMIERGDSQQLFAVEQELKRRYAGKSTGYADYLFGKLDLARGNWPASQVKLTRALDSFGKQPRILAKTHDALGRCAKFANNPERMAACFSAALQADPLLDSAKLGLAEANARRGRGTDANTTFRQFADVNPDARVMLVRLLFEEQLQRPPDRRDWHSFDEALGKPPYPPGLQNLHLASLRVRGHKEDALAAAKALSEQVPPNLAGYLAYATLLTETDRKAALATLARAESAIGDRVEIRLAKATILALDGKTDPVTALVEDVSAFEKTDDRYALYSGIAEVLIRMRKLEAAAEYWKKAAETKPKELIARAKLAELYLSLKRDADCDLAIEELRTLDGAEGPTYLFAFCSKAAVGLTDTSRLPDLRAKMATVLRMRPAWGRAALLAAELDDAAGDSDAALEKFRRAFALGERRPSGVQRLVTLLVARGRLDEARKILSDAEQTVGLSDDLHRQSSLLDLLTNKPETKAEDLVKSAADSKVPVDHIFRGQWYLLANRPMDSALAFEKALALDPNQPDAWLGLIFANSASGNMNAANAAWDRAKTALSTMKLSDPALLPQWLGLGREALRDSAGAEAIYKDGLAKHPDSPALLLQLGVLYQNLSRSGDAAVQFRKLLSTNANDAAKRFARRELAYATADRSAALELLKTNEPPSPDDLRMKGLILTNDPFRRSEARKLIAQAASLAAPSQFDAVRLVDFYIRDDDTARAEELLRDVTRGGATAPVRYVILLHYLQRKLKKDADADATLERLTKLVPGTWELAVEQVRAKIAHGDRTDAAKGLLAHSFVVDPARKLVVAVPALIDLGCTTEAEEILKTALDTSKLPERFPQMIYFLASQNRGLDAIRLAIAMPDTEYPASLKSRMLYSMFLPLPRAAAADKAEWDKLAETATNWLNTQLAKTPNESSLLTLQGVLLDGRGQTEAAILSFEKAMNADSKAETAANALAYLLVVGPSPDAARAETIVNKLISDFGPKPALLDTRALARLALGKLPEASADIEAAIVQLPGKAGYYFRLAQVRDRNGDFPAKALAVRTGMQLGLKKESLHPLEWSAFEKLFSTSRN